MSDLDPVYVNIPCPSKEEGIALCTKMLEKELCGTAKVQEGVHLMWKEESVESADVVLLNLKTTKGNIPKIHEFILQNHSWKTPCIEVLPVVSDMC